MKCFPTRAAAIACGAMWWTLAVAAGPGDTAAPTDPPAAPRVHMADLLERAAVERAVRGAMARLERPACEAVLGDFADTTGTPLRINLDATARSAPEYLVERLWFVDASEQPQCRDTEATVAFTTAGDDLIRVCAAKFASRYARLKTAGELLIIHEMLHSLGLGEDPPSSAEITRRVAKRCTFLGEE